MKTAKMKSNIKKEDNVVIIAGDDRGKRGKVTNISPERNKVIVEGINKIKKFVKRSQENPKGGVLVIERPINLSNVMYFCEKCKKGVRLSITVKDGNRVRTCKKCGKTIE